MSRRFEVWQYCSKRFEGNAEEFRAMLVEFYTAKINQALKRVDEITNADASELGRLASREDCWSIEETPEFKNVPRFKVN